MKPVFETLGLCLACVGTAAVIFVAERGAAEPPADLKVLVMNKLREAAPDSTVEFREGDTIPYDMRFSGDLLETETTGASYITVKKTFWVRAEGQQILLSFDGEHFRPANEVLGGELTANAGAEQNHGLATAIHTTFNAVLK